MLSRTRSQVSPMQPDRRRAHILPFAAAALVVAVCSTGMRALSFVPAPLRTPARRSTVAAASNSEANLAISPSASLQADGWKMMPLGVPKVAYRIPGAPNAEWVDIYNRLYRERIIFLGKEIDDRLANEIIGVLLYLDSEDNSKPIYLYINSPGGSVISGLAIYDTMQHIKSPVVTINVGLAASMASFLLASGEKGKRMALPHSRTMIHQAVGGAQGQAEDIKVEAQQILNIHEKIVNLYSSMTGKEADTVRKDLQRDNFMSAVQAQEYGIIDRVIQLETVKLEEREPPTAVADTVEKQDAPAEVSGPGVATSADGGEVDDVKPVS
mmetsp:Transcript_72386/g.172496  ORF Transcript_72386/g.172496 Transcript_72386/m.172496 type:complete len:326 (-) Transcript_72386:139-1116(-)